MNRSGYVAERVEPTRWALAFDGRPLSDHAGYRDAVRAAQADDRSRRRRRILARHAITLLLVITALGSTVAVRETSNPAFGPARAFADVMEMTYSEIEDGVLDIEAVDATVEDVRGGAFTLTRGGVEAEYLVLTGAHDDNCYVIRWVSGDLPFVARLLSGRSCEPDGTALSFAQSRFEAIAVGQIAGSPLEWSAVLPDEVALRPWFFPATMLLIFLVLQQLISLSLVVLRGVAQRRIDVTRIEPGD